jgi:hypothetical protein
MIALVFAMIAYCRAFFIGRHRLGMEVAALRHQLVVFNRKHHALSSSREFCNDISGDA